MVGRTWPGAVGQASAATLQGMLGSCLGPALVGRGRRPGRPCLEPQGCLQFGVVEGRTTELER